MSRVFAEACGDLPEKASWSVTYGITEDETPTPTDDSQGVTFLQLLAFIASAGGHISFNQALFSQYAFIIMPEEARQIINALALRINDDFLYSRPVEDAEDRLARDGANIRVSILSPTGLDAQMGDDGATWLDRELASRQRMLPADEGFGREVKTALEKRE
jgi:hypothetical protein